MFYLLSKVILHDRHNLFVSPKYVTVKYISTSSNANEHSFTVSYLINSCGLSLESALSASKYVYFDTPEKPDSVIRFFKNHGFSKTQISTVIRRRPQFLLSSAGKTFLPKFNFFYSKGFSSPDLAKILSAQPSILHRSLHKQIIPSFDFFKDLLKSDESTVLAIKFCPFMITYDIHTCVLQNAKILGEHGVPESHIYLFLRTRPSIFILKSELFKEIVEKLKGMGFDPKEIKFGLAMFVFKGMGKSVWNRKVDVYKKWGLSEEEIVEAFLKNPLCMVSSEDKIMAIMDCFVRKMGCKALFVAERPSLATFSLEKRIVPRGSVAEALLSKGLIKNDCLSTLFHTSEKLFLKRFVNHYKEEAPQLLKLYNEKLNLSR